MSVPISKKHNLKNSSTFSQKNQSNYHIPIPSEASQKNKGILPNIGVSNNNKIFLKNETNSKNLPSFFASTKKGNKKAKNLQEKAIEGNQLVTEDKENFQNCQMKTPELYKKK